MAGVDWGAVASQAHGITPGKVNWGSQSGWNLPTKVSAGPAPKKSSGGGGGFLGSLEGLVTNAGHDIASTVTSIPQSVEGLARMTAHTLGPSGVTQNIGWGPLDRLLSPVENRHPPRETFLSDKRGLGGGALEPFIAQEKATYGPALHGNFHPLYEHPLTPILDAASLASLGGGAALRGAEAGVLGARAAQLARGERVLRSGDLAETVNRAKTLQGRALQRRIDEFSHAHPDTPIVGVNPRLSRIATARTIRRSAVDRAPVRLFQRSLAPLTKDERFAFHIAAEGVPLDERLAFYHERLAETPTRTLADYVKRMQRPGVREALTSPRPQFIDALRAGRDLESKAGQRLVASGRLNPETRAERAVLPQRIMGGTAEAVPSRTIRSGGETIRTAPEVVGGNAENLVGRPNRVHEALPEPFRFPHQGPSAGGGAGLFTGPTLSSALREKALPGFLHRNQAVRLHTARLMTNPEVLSRDFLSTARDAHLNDIRRQILGPVAKPLDESLHGGKLPGEHYYYERRSTTVPPQVREQQALAQDVGAVDSRGRELAVAKAAGDKVFHELPPEMRDYSIARLNELGVRRVPAAFAKRYQDSFAGTGPGGRIFDRYTSFYRYLTLNIRPAWMTTNLVGNLAQYGLRYAGADGVAAYLRALLATERGDDKFLHLWKYTRSVPTLRRRYGRIFEEVAPEIKSAGLYGTQAKLMHGGVYEGKFAPLFETRLGRVIGSGARGVGKVLGSVAHGITYLETHFAEDVPREAAMMRELSPTIRKLGLANASMETALKSLSRRDVELAVDRVNDFLGDFSAHTGFERRLVKRAVPFEAWYRVIVQVSAKLALHYPGRVRMLDSLAQQYQADNENLPSWLRGAIKIGSPSKAGVQSLVSTSSLNPFETVPQLLTQNPAGTLNPLLGAAITGATNVDPYTLSSYHGPGATKRNDLPAYLERFFGAAASNTAPTELQLAQHLAGPSQSKLYAPHTYGHLGPVPLNDYLLQFLGLPLRHVRLEQARRDRGL